MTDETVVKVPKTAIRAERGEGNPLDKLETYFRQAIFGQDRAIESVVRALNRAKYRFNAGREDRPIAVILFLGPTGVGKTETAKRLARYLHPNGGGFLKIDCSLFSQGHEISALVGAPPAYVGRDQAPLFDPEVINTPNSVILFDEIEKASTEFRHLMLQIMEDGEVTLLNGGQRVNFRNSIIIMTTNSGAREMVDYIQGRRLGFSSSRENVEKMGANIYSIGFMALQRVFAPEWLNRIDEFVAFRPLAYETLVQIMDHMLAEANEKYLYQGLQVFLTNEAKELILQKSFTPEFGARPVRARLMKEIEAPLADMLASGGIPKGSRVWVDVTGDTEFGKELAFFYEHDERLLEIARENEEKERQRLEPVESGNKAAAVPHTSRTLSPTRPRDSRDSRE